MGNVLKTINFGYPPEIKSITVTNDGSELEIVGPDDELWRTKVPSSPHVKVEMELNGSQLTSLENALRENNGMSAVEKETRKQLGIMHEVQACNGRNIKDKFNDYLSKKEKKKCNKAKEPAMATTGRYKIKYR